MEVSIRWIYVVSFEVDDEKHLTQDWSTKLFNLSLRFKFGTQLSTGLDGLKYPVRKPSKKTPNVKQHFTSKLKRILPFLWI